MTERHIELTWRCSSCGHRSLGRHMVCQGCGNPKDDSEEYEMPPDPAAIASVTDSNLLAMAEAGANWRCQYCGSQQRDMHGGCMRCGAGRAHGANARPVAMPPIAPAPFTPTRRFGGGAIVLLVALACVLLGTCVYAVGRSKRAPIAPAPTAVPPPRTEFTGTVTAVSWKRRVTVERWQLASHEGFTAEIPAGSVDVRATGQHVHHTEEVFDHDETVYDVVEVPDGYRTETYSERVRCGEDCTTTTRTCRKVCTRSSKSCRQECTNKKNGFASCREVCTGGNETCRDDCTGGDRKCETKYCNETRTRQIPKTRTERRPRVVKRYRTEPRYAAWSTYKTWEWVAVRNVEDGADDVTPKWPDAGVRVADAAAPKSGDEREVRSETLAVTIQTDDGRTHAYTPSSEDELHQLAPKSEVAVRIVAGSLTILGPSSMVSSAASAK